MPLRSAMRAMSWFWSALNKASMIFFLVGSFLATGEVFFTTPQSIARETPRVFAGIPPVGFLVERLASPFVQLETVVEGSQDPHIFEPTPRQIIEIKKATVFFSIGLPFERILEEKLSQSEPKVRVVRLIPESLTKEDPHVWLSPSLLKGMAQEIASALVSVIPEHSAEIQERLKRLLKEIETMHHDIQARLAPYRGRTFLAYHGAFGHFADEFGLNQMAVEIEGKELSPKRLSTVIEKARKEKVPILIVQPQFDPRSARLVAQSLKARLVVIDPMESDVFGTIRRLGDVLAEAYGDRHGK